MSRIRPRVRSGAPRNGEGPSAMRLASTLMRLALVVSVLATPVLATDEDGLVRAVKDARDAREPAATFLSSLVSLPDLDLDGEAVRASLKKAGVQATGPVGAILAA